MAWTAARPLFAALAVAVLSVVARPVAARAEEGAPVRPAIADGTWSADSAAVLPRRRVEVGLLSETRISLGGRFELSTQPWLDLLRLPNVGVKARLADRGSWVLAAKTTLSYPTPFLKSFAHRGPFGILPEDQPIPQLVAAHARLLVTARPNAGRELTLEAGARLAAQVGENGMSSIDLPILFPRTSAYLHGATLQAGLDTRARVVGRLWAHGDLDLFVMRDPRGRYAAEYRLLAAWLGHRFAVEAGVKGTHGEYPFGTQEHLLPYVDVQVAFGG